MVSKSDITTNIPATNDLIQVASGEKVLAETENSNNLLNLNAIILAYNQHLAQCIVSLAISYIKY